MIERKKYKIKLRGFTSSMAKKRNISKEMNDIKEINKTSEVDISFDHPRLLVYQLIRRCHDYITVETDKNLASLGSSQAQYQVLRILVDLHTVSMTKISRLLFRGKSNSTSLIDRMERAGLVKRIHLKEDRRVSNIEITQKGKELHDKVAKYHRLFILEKFKGLSDQEVDDLLKLLGKTVHVLNPEGAVFNVDVQDKQG